MASAIFQWRLIVIMLAIAIITVIGVVIAAQTGAFDKDDDGSD